MQYNIRLTLETDPWLGAIPDGWPAANMAAKEICWQVEQLKGLISPCPSCLSNKSGQWYQQRLCVYYRRLNNITITILPQIDDKLDILTGKQSFSTMDLASCYWQILLSNDAR